MKMWRNLTHIPQEIIEEILPWLPVKSICRFHCVSKSWRALFSEQEFIKAQLNRAKKLQRESILLRIEGESLFSAALSNVDHLLHDRSALGTKKLSFAGLSHSDGNIIAACDGLVLVVDNGTCFLINPTTGEIKELEPSCVIYYWGLGYDIVSDDYKVTARTTDFEDTGEPDFLLVYSVRNGTWKKVDVFFDYIDFPSHGFFLHGSIHWLAGKCIRALNLAEEKVYEVPPPSISLVDKEDDDFWSNAVVVVLGRCLCVVCYINCPRKADIWTMKEYGVKESWTKFTIVHPEPNECLFLCKLDEKRALLLQCEELMLGSFEQGMFKRSFEGYHISDTFDLAVTFVESLISPFDSYEIWRTQHPTVEETSWADFYKSCFFSESP